MTSVCTCGCLRRPLPTLDEVRDRWVPIGELVNAISEESRGEQDR